MKSFFIFILLFFQAALLYPVDSVLILDENAEIQNENVFVRHKMEDNSAFALTDYDDSDWEILPLPVPSGWYEQPHVGIGWYRFSFYLPESLKDQSLGISLGNISSASETYLNGVLIASDGIIGEGFTESYNKKRLYRLSADLLNFGETNTIAVRAQNSLDFGKMGHFRIVYPEFGNYTQMQEEFFTREFMTLSVILLYLFLCLLYYMLNLSKDRSMRRNNGFGMFLVVTASTRFFLSQWPWILGIPYRIISWAIFSSISWLAPLFLHFIVEEFPPSPLYHPHLSRFSKISSKASLLFAFLFTLVMAFSPELKTREILNMALDYPVSLFAMTSAGVILFHEHRKKNRDATLVLLAFAPLFLAMLYDILMDFQRSYSKVTFSYALLIFIVTIFIILQNKVAQIFKKAERGSVELDRSQNMKFEFAIQFSKALHEPVSQIQEKLIQLSLARHPSFAERKEFLEQTHELALQADSVITRTFAPLHRKAEKHPEAYGVFLRSLISKALYQNKESFEKKRLFLKTNFESAAPVLGDKSDLLFVIQEAVEAATSLSRPGKVFHILIFDQNQEQLQMDIRFSLPETQLPATTMDLFRKKERDIIGRMGLSQSARLLRQNGGRIRFSFPRNRSEGTLILIFQKSPGKSEK